MYLRNSGSVIWTDVWAPVVVGNRVHGSKNGWYADGETAVWFAVGRTHAIGIAELVVKLSGYLTAE